LIGQSRQKKSLGQHWLKDETALRQIIDLLEIKKGDTVVEIGPGKGALTKYLIQKPINLIAVEYDKSLADQLYKDELYKDGPCKSGFDVINIDFLEFDLESLPAGYKIVGNIPYYITGKIARKCLCARNKPSLVVLLVQKEVAERIAAPVGELSILGVMSQFYAEVSLGPVVTADKFDPPPKVDSQVVVLKPRVTAGSLPRVIASDSEAIQPTESGLPRRSAPRNDAMTRLPRQTSLPRNDSALQEKAFERVVKAGFSAKRKKLHTALAGGLNISVDDAKKLLHTAKIDSNLRAQELSVADWARLAELQASGFPPSRE
jgi:16S rRNA (adenine1518-N6/adenine1519-N6)-dimethyltransferase